MIADFARALLMSHGHDPRDVDDYPWKDVECFLKLWMSNR